MALLDALRDALWQRDKGLCGICKLALKRADVAIDHIIPRSHGGPDSFANLRPTHPQCNRRRWTGRVLKSGELRPAPIKRLRPRMRRPHGDSLHRRASDGLWCATLELEKDPVTGQRRRRNFYGHTPEEAQARLHAAFPEQVWTYDYVATND
jgi:HNH endonuclease